MKRKTNRRPPLLRDISWSRLAEMFGNPRPPLSISEQQFDYCDAELRLLASQPYLSMDLSKLGYYYADLAFVELQPDLFDYLFPACLMDWHRSLADNRPCGGGTAEIHFAVSYGQVFRKMLSPDRLLAVRNFLLDSFLARLDAETRLFDIQNAAPSWCWIRRINSLARIVDLTELWEQWWSLGTPGRAIAAIQYVSALLYFDDENPLFPAELTPVLWSHDSQIHHAGWLPANGEFLSQSFTAEFVKRKIQEAVAMLPAGQEREKARQLLTDLPAQEELLDHRIAELPGQLLSPDPAEWTV
ncbi:hypothetical protein [Lignipirellula cremea]|nr:hypothetical protein [Lignipirellula cremea]